MSELGLIGEGSGFAGLDSKSPEPGRFQLMYSVVLNLVIILLSVIV